MSEQPPLIYPDADALAHAAASELLRLADEAVTERGAFTLSLSGGSTPRKLYTILGSDPAFAVFPWEQTHFFFGDERHVPPDDPESNFGMAKHTLFVSGMVPAANIHRVPAELPDSAQAAAAYEAEMQRFFQPPMLLNGFPRFDVILLGMGPDGHTASLFPDSPGLQEKTRWFIANPVEKFKTDRLTFTFPVLNAARGVYLLVAGKDKAAMIAKVLAEPHGPFPVEQVQPSAGDKIWMLDQAAAAQLPSS